MSTNGLQSIEAPATLPRLPGVTAITHLPPAERQGRRSALLGDLLVNLGAVSPEQLLQARLTGQEQKLSLARVLVREGLVLPRDMAALMALHLSVPMVDLRSQAINADALETVPEHIARRYGVLPLRKSGIELTVAMADPTDYRTMHDLRVRTGCVLHPIIATAEDILEHIDISYRLTEGLGEESEETPSKATGGKVTARQLVDSPPAQVIDLLLQQATQDRASDIHVTPAEAHLRVRFRIDGLLHDVMTLPTKMHPLIISRLKIMAGLNIAERRRPQDGHFTSEVGDHKVDVRVAISNTVHGEMGVLRLLDKRFTLLGLDQVGMASDALGRFRKLLRLPHGMIIVCGPTGAGKSTTLYASILEMNRMEQNVMSLEDPVEYQIADTNQMQIHAEAGITFANQLRSILRLDPDVILVGEIRDHETATIATQAALTGHLVLTSLHANDSVSALVRLRDLDVAPYLIASSVAGILSQRMVRVVCSGCKALKTAPAVEQEAYAQEMREAQHSFAYGLGCNVCAHTGYRGRTGVFELLAVSDELRQIFLADGSRRQLLERALLDGMTPLRHAGMVKVKQGTTTPYEVMRVLFSLD
ncbi:MAG: Flp pilus assembly complex ATPase component TadA [Chloroflexi bacterium]|nr:Flp pilus assembly complex ATPase component TadA [Chloroflexota bacterium]